MDKKIAKKWIVALRSGKYTQGKGILCIEDNKTPKYCCLGVLCDIMETPYKIEQQSNYGLKNYGIKKYGKDGDFNSLPFEVRQKALIGTESGHIREMQTSLSCLNDAGMSFLEIADIIEDNIDNL